MIITNIEEEIKVLKYLNRKNILKQYKKVKNMILLWYLKQVDFKIRQPKKDKIFYFRINKQYRWYCYFDWNTLIVFRIDDHQN